jgi:hypothetical protein
MRPLYCVMMALALCGIAGATAADARAKRITPRKADASRPLKILPFLTLPGHKAKRVATLKTRKAARRHTIAREPGLATLLSPGKAKAERPRAGPAAPTVRKSLRRIRHAKWTPARRAIVRASRPPASLSRAEFSLVAFTLGQREAIYRMIAEAPVQPRPVATERVAPAVPSPSPPSAVAGDLGAPADQPTEYPVGTKLPGTVVLHAMPRSVIEAVPSIEPYFYAFVGHRLLLVDPATATVVASIALAEAEKR